MDTTTSPKGMTRRQLLSRATAAGAAFVVGAGFMAAPDAAWAVEMKALSPETFATLTQMARDVYPHDKVADEYYAAAVQMYDTNEGAEGIEAGIAALAASASPAAMAS